MTIPVGTGTGAHTVYAVGSLGTQANIGVLRDNAAPGVSAAVVQKVAGGTAGFVHQGGQYYVYANVTDNGSPASGLQSVTANVSTVTTGQTAVPMTAGTWTVGVTTYNYRSALLTADAVLAAGAKSFSITATDLAANVTTQGGFAVTVDNSAPIVTALVIQKAAGGTAGAVRQGGQYYVYANVTDAGGSGLESVSANAANLSTGQSAAAMSAGSWTVGVTTYNHRSALLTANNPLTQGVTTFTATASDGAANATTSAATNVTIDDTAPAIGAVVIQKSAGGVTGSIRQGGQYFVYASVTDAGGSGVESVTANVSTVTAGQTAAPLAAGSWTIGVTTYNYRTAVLTADNPLTAGAKAYTVAATDGAGNATTSGSASVTVDNTVPAATDVQTANAAAGTVGHAEAGDTITFTFSEPMEPISFLAGWTGAGTSVTVRLNNVAAADTVRVFNAANTTALPFGTVALGRTDYTTANRTFTALTMVMSGNTIDDHASGPRAAPPAPRPATAGHDVDPGHDGHGRGGQRAPLPWPLRAERRTGSSEGPAAAWIRLGPMRADLEEMQDDSSPDVRPPLPPPVRPTWSMRSPRSPITRLGGTSSARLGVRGSREWSPWCSPASSCWAPRSRRRSAPGRRAARAMSSRSWRRTRATRSVGTRAS